jgi:SSS family transporter
VSVQATVFLLYFAVVFALGWFALRRTRTESDYWIAGGNLGWLLGGATLAATHTSAGSFVGTVGVIHTVGWSFAWVLLSIPLAYWFTVGVLAPRFTRVRELTLPAFLEARYASKGVRALGAVVILVAVVVFVQAQIVAGGLIANAAFGIPARTGMIVFAVVLVLYTVVGGMLAVVYTDFLQLVVMAVGVLLAVPLSLRHFDGPGDFVARVQAANPAAFDWGSMPGSLLFTMGLAFMLGSVATPEKLVRLYAMRDMRAIRRGVMLAVGAICGINFLLFFLALASRALYPTLPSGDLAMPVMAATVLPPVLGALLLAAITAAMMSTVDSLLVVAGAALSHDIYQSILHPEASERRRLWVDRIGIALVGVAPLILILSGVGEGTLIQFIVLLFSALMAASFFVPVVFGVYWRRANRQGAAASMIGGLLTVFAWKVFGPGSVDPVLPGFLVSAALMVGVSLATPPSPRTAVDPYFPTGPVPSESD